MLELRLLNDEDISLVENWLHREHVKRWYEIPHLGVSISDWMYELKERYYHAALHCKTLNAAVIFCIRNRDADSRCTCLNFMTP